MSKAIFLDRDGVINEVKSKRVHFVNKPEQFYFLNGVAESIKKLNKSGYAVFVVTNQGGVGLGYMTEEMLEQIHKKMVDELSKKGAIIKEVRACIHKPQANCRCRKPKPGMLLDLIEKYDIDVKKSYMIGDREPDIDAGNAAGVTSLMVVDQYDEAYRCFADLKEATEWILKNG